MNLRKPVLPLGWYPRDKTKITGFLYSCRAANAAADSEDKALAVIGPHAGWYYSGVCAAKAVLSLQKEAETVAIIGGHLPAGKPVLVAAEDAAETPFGILEMDTELREVFREKIAFQDDRYADNTVEVLLPMVHCLFPNARLLWLRFPAEISSYRAGEVLAETAMGLGRRLGVVASADLTHYGTNYGFNPKGRGKAALDWVKNVNDAGFIKAVLDGSPDSVLDHAEKNQSTCSAGSVLGALGFAAFHKKTERRLLEYYTSADIRDDESDRGIPDSFVGYAAIAFN